MRIRSLPVVCAMALLPLTAAAQTGAISGAVTSAATSAPLADIGVHAFNTAGAFVGQATSDGAGGYLISELAPGTYYLATETTTGLINEIYDNIPCISYCAFNVDAILAGTAVVVTAGATAADRNFQLAPGGQIRGTVRDAATLAPLPNVLVTLRNSSGGPVASHFTDAMGRYATQVGLASGNYFAFTTNSAGYFDEIYDNVRCTTPGCSPFTTPSVGTPIGVTAPNQTTGIDFPLSKGASVAGVVTDAVTGAPLPSVLVFIVRPSGTTADIVSTGGSGAFQSAALDAGSYYLYTSNSDGYVNERYDDVPCPGPCHAVAGGTLVTLAAGEARTGLGFALARGGRISGTIRHAASLTPLSNITVYLYTSTGVFISNAFTDEQGVYVSSTGLPTGTYYAHTQNSEGYLDEFYDNVPCPPFCQTTAVTGTPIAVTLGQTTSGRDFLLDRGGRITGRVTGPDGAAVQGVTVQASDGVSGPVSAQTNGAGHYTIAGLRPGSYYLLTSGADARGLVNEIYDNRTCPVTCQSATAKAVGARVALGFESVVENIDFALAAGGSIAGTIVDAATGAPLQNLSVTVINNTVTSFSTGATGPTGAFSVGGLPTGTYYAYTSNTAGFIDEMHGNIACVGGCRFFAVTAGTPIAVTIGAATGGVHFALERGGQISGRVTDAATSQPIASVQVNFLDALGQFVAAVRGDASGNYTSPGGLPTGSYYVYTVDAPGYVQEIFDNVPCAGDCALLVPAGTATPVAVISGATATGKDFALDPGGRIAGVVTDAATGAVLNSVRLDFYDTVGRFVTYGFTSQGQYITNGGLRSGTYVAFTDADEYINEVYDDLPCPAGCTPSRASSGTPITVTVGEVTSGRNFSLTRRSGVPGQPLDVQAHTSALGLLIKWSAPSAGGTAASYQLEAGLTPGTTALSIPVADTEHLFAGAPPGVYYLRVKGVNAAGVGPASPEFTLTIGAGGAPPGTPQFLRATMNGARLILEWRVAASGGTPSVYLVEAGTATGLANIATIPVATTGFTYDPVPNGFYFLRARAQNASGTSAPSNEAMIVVGGVPAPPASPASFAATVSGSTVTLNWLAPPGSVTGYILEAGSASGLSNLAVVPLAPSTTASFPGIPPGTYYARIRAVNALGRGVASDDVVIVVG